MCAVCMWCQFLDGELETPSYLRSDPKPAMTAVAGTALCRLHLEDFQRTRDPFTAAASIVGIHNPKAFPREPHGK